MRRKPIASKLIHATRIALGAIAALQLSVGPTIVAAASLSPDDNTNSPIKHVIVIVGENRSFDHLYATYAPKHKHERVLNLLSEGIINADGTPGPNFAKAHQYKIVSAPNGGKFFSSADLANKELYATLPAPDLNGVQDPPAAILLTLGGDPGLAPQDQFLMGTGGTGLPFTVHATTDTSGTGENTDRGDQIGNPSAGVSHSLVSHYYVQWVNPAAFQDPPPGSFGTMRRNQLTGPGFASVDLSVFKNIPVTERLKAQFRVEMFNIFNRLNLAPPSGYLFGGFGQSTDTIGDYNGAPGIGPGEPFSMQLAVKLIF